MPISSAFKGATPEDAMISTIMMVGAEPGFQNGLGSNDRSLLTAFLRLMEMLKIPLGSEIAPFKNLDNPVGENTAGVAPVEIVNRLKEFGGRDFFLEEGHPDAVVLCNIPAQPHVEEQDWAAGTVHYSLDERNLLRKAFAVSDYHHEEDDWYNWRTKMAEMKPKFILLSGSDSFDPALFKQSGYVLITGAGTAQGLYVSKDYLSAVGAYLLMNDSPLFECTRTDHDQYSLRLDTGFGSAAPALRLERG